MVTVADAERIIQAEVRDYGTEHLSFAIAMGRVLAGDIHADRDLPSCNRVIVDGIAIRYGTFEKGVRSFPVRGVVAAGNAPIELAFEEECVEIMTGGPLPDTADTMVRYEDVTIEGGVATITVNAIKKGQNVHRRARDRKQGDAVVRGGRLVDATTISIAASVGMQALPVKKLPRVIIIATGDELVDIDQEPTPYQVRSSNNHTVKAVLQQYGLQADMLHIPDDAAITKEKVGQCLTEYDVLIMTGGVSMGKYDYVPEVLMELGVARLFHKVQQRPGKPFWFGKHAKGTLVFAFPGNPVSVFLCLHRYFIPWLMGGTMLAGNVAPGAVLNEDVMFEPALQYFMQVRLSISGHGQLLATPVQGNGSGDFANLPDSDAFMELPREQAIFKKGEAYPVWPFKKII